MGNSKTITVKTEGGDVIVHKLALGDYAVLLRALKQLPKKFGAFLEENEAGDLQDTSKLFAVLPDIIADALPEFCDLLSVVSDQDAEYFINGDLADAIDVLAAALELNDYKRVTESVKKIMARKQPADPALQAKK